MQSTHSQVAPPNVGGRGAEAPTIGPLVLPQPGHSRAGAGCRSVTARVQYIK